MRPSAKQKPKERKMNNLKLARADGTRWFMWLSLTIGLALLILVVLLYGLRAVSPAYADPGTLYVDDASGSDTGNCQDPGTPCQTIGYAISQAGNADAIQVAQGTYIENPIINISVTLEGGYEPISWTRSITQYETIIDGSGSTTQSVVTIPEGTFDVVLDGLTVTGGDTTDNGGGVVIWSDGTVIIANSVITGNMSSGDGGGIAAYGLTLTMQNVVVANNQAGELIPPGNGGGLYFRNGVQATLTSVQVYSNTAVEGGGGIKVDDPGTSVVISDTQIYSNTALGYGGAPVVGGGGIGVSQGSLSLSNSSVLANAAPNNEGGGIHVSDGGSADVVDSIIVDNLTKDHGGAVSTGQATVNLTNVLITGNETTSDNGNVLAVNESDVTIINSTISDNNPQGAQAVILWSGNLTITNSIMWNNALNLQGDPPCPTCFTVTYSDIEGSWPGTGNLNEDPLFVDAGDYHLRPGSPAIDTGTDTGAPDHDLGGNPRPLDGDGDSTAVTDMGAYELRLHQIYLPLTCKNFGQ
jgi:hypothetical protein